MDVVARHPQLLQVRAHRGGRKAEIAQRGDRRSCRPLGELLPVLAEDQPVVDVLGRSRPERLVEATMEILVGPVVVAPVHVRDPEVGVVDHAREMVGRGAVLAEKRDAVEAVRSDPLGRLPVAVLAGALANRPLVPGDPEPREVVEDRLVSLPRYFRAGSVSSIRSSIQSPARRLMTALRALPTWSEPVGLGAKRTRTIGSI